MREIPSSAKLDITYSFPGNDMPFLSRLIESFKDPQRMWLEIKWAIAIQVTGDSEPQVLVRIDRSNWTDFAIYGRSKGGIITQLWYSTREVDSLKWSVKHGALTGIEIWDRWGSPPERLMGKEKPVERWYEVRRYSYDTKKLCWKMRSSRWVALAPEKRVRNKAIEKPSDCVFRYLGKAGPMIAVKNGG